MRDWAGFPRSVDHRLTHAQVTGPHVSVQVVNEVGIAIWGKGSGAALCIVDNTGIAGFGAIGQTRQPGHDPFEVLASGTSFPNEVWALVRIPQSTESISVSLARGHASIRRMSDGFAVVSFSNRVARQTRWP